MTTARAASGRSGAQAAPETPRGARISDHDFRRLGEFIAARCGIRITEAKRTLVETRLQKRLQALKLPGFGEYCDYLFGPKGLAEELVPMIDLITTNKTDFFRESAHLDLLAARAAPALLAETGAGTRRPLRVWSAGCSTGEEPYSLAMVLSEFAERTPGFRFEILATDISTRVLERAAGAVYEEDRVEPVPEGMRRKYLLRSKDRNRGLVRIAPELRALVTFRRLNFMDEEYDVGERKDVVFCRNVIIYFDKTTQETILNRIARCMGPGAFLFTGHSETLFGLRTPFRQVASTVYRREAS